MTIRPSTSKTTRPGEASYRAASWALRLAREGTPLPEDDPFHDDWRRAVDAVGDRLRSVEFAGADHDGLDSNDHESSLARLAAACADRAVQSCEHCGPWPQPTTILLDHAVELCDDCVAGVEAPVVPGAPCGWCDRPASWGAATYFHRVGTIVVFGSVCLSCARAMESP